ncbi:MAG: hypothetical protein E7595_04865 [Ruminococcaceae bacterium]|nr:hypothetical protein [Oscillospiraceae bacterium]
MKCLERNKTKFYYALFVDDEPGKDEYGNESGEPRIIYSEPVLAKANISPATGVSQVEQFGKELKYDKVIVLDDITCPIDENSVLFVDKQPEKDDDGNLLFDYIVKKVARSLNSVSIAISKVAVS